MAQQLPIPPDLDPEFACYAIRWPISVEWRSFLLGWFDSMQFGPTWDASTGSVVDVLEVGREIWNLNQDLEGVLLTCGNVDELVSAIATASASASASSSCGACDTGSRGLGQEAPPAIEEPLIDDGIEEPPTGFDDWTEYEQYKCNAATLIIDNMIRDLGQMSGGTFLGLTILEVAIGIAVVLLTPIPADDVIAIAGVILGVIAISFGTFDDAQSILTSNKDEFVCILFEANTVSSAIAAFNNKVAEIADAQFPTQPNNYWIELLLFHMANAGNFNRLVELDNFQEYPVGDCSSCGTCLPIWCYDDGLQGWTFASESDPGTFAFGSHSVPNEATLTNLQLPSLPNLSAIGRWSLTLPAGTIVRAGDTLQADVLATSDGNQTQFRFELYFVGGGSEIGPNLLWSGATQLQHIVTSVDEEIERVEYVVSRSTGAGAFGSQSNNFVQQFAMDLSDPVVCPVGPCDT